MHPNYYLSPLAVCLALTMSTSARSAQPVPLTHTTLQNIQQQFQIELPGVKQTIREHVVNSLFFLKSHKDKRHVNHVRMQQKYAGFEVFGGYAILHSSSSLKTMIAGNAAVTMNGTVYQGLETELGAPSATFENNSIVALQHFKEQYAGKAISEEQVTPIVYIDEQHKAHWAYKVTMLVTYKDKIPARPVAIVDAVSFKPWVTWNNIKTKSHIPVKGTGHGGNHKTGMYTYGQDMPFLELTRSENKNKCFMENTDVRIVDMEHEYYSDNQPMQFSCMSNAADPLAAFWTGSTGDGYDKYNGAFSPSNDALYEGNVIKHMYHDWYKVEALTKEDGSPMQLVMRVHYGDGFENAYWDGKQMTFGDGEELMYPLVSLGVAAHEVSHGFTEQHSNLEYSGQSGGMNESFSDMAAMAAEFYSLGKNTWMIGSEIMKENSGYESLRYMDMPSKDGVSIDKATDYDSGLDVHFSSGVYNRFFYLLATSEGWDPRKAFAVMLAANMDYWTPLSTFDEGACGVLSAAQDLGYPLEDIKKSLDEVAVKYESCMATPEPAPAPPPEST